MDFKRLFRIMLIVFGIFFLLNIIMVIINPPEEEEEKVPVVAISPYLSEVNLEVVSAEGTVEPMNISAWRGEDGLVYIMGEIVNDLGETIEPRWVRVSMFDEGGNKLSEEETFPYAFYLGPGDKSPFVLMTTNLPQKVMLSAEYKVTEEIPFDFEVKQGELFNSDQDSSIMVIEGEVVNNDDRKAEDVQVMVTFYDEKGRVIDVRKAEWTKRYSRTTSIDLRPGSTHRFNLDFKPDEKMKDYHVSVVACEGH